MYPNTISLVSTGTDKRVGPVCRPQGAGSDNFGWQDMVVFQKIEETSVPPNLVPPRGPSDHQPATGKPFGEPAEEGKRTRNLCGWEGDRAIETCASETYELGDLCLLCIRASFLERFFSPRERL